MFSKTESTLDRPAAAKRQSEQVVSFRYSRPGVLRHDPNGEDFSRGVEETLSQNYHLLPGCSDVLSSWYNDNDFVIIIRGFEATSVIRVNDVEMYKSFMKEYGSYPSVWHLVAPFPKHEPVNPANYTKYDPRRGY